MAQAKTVIKQGVLQGDLDCGGFKLLNVDLTDIISEEFGQQAANSFFAGPIIGDPLNPAFRAMVNADLPADAMLVTENLAGLSNYTTARANLGLTTTATATNTVTGLQLLNMATPALEGTEFMIASDGQPDWVGGATVLSSIGAEPVLGNPGVTGYVLSSTTGGVRSWVAQTAAVLPVADTTALVKGSADATKLLRIEVDGFTTATTRVLTAPNKDGTIACTSDIPFTAGILFGADEDGRSLILAGGDVAFYGEFTMSGSGFSTLIAATGNTSVILPLTGTLATLDGVEDLTNKTYNGITLSGTGGITLVDATVSIEGGFTTEGEVTILSAGGLSSFTTVITATDDTDITLPTSGTLATRENAETLANKTLEAVAAIGIKNATSGFDLNLVNINSLASLDRNLNINLGNADRTLTLAGNLTLAGSLTTVGAFGTTLTATATTALTLPTTGTLAAWVTNPPATSASDGVAGQMAYDGSGNFYVCYATNSWGLVALDTSFP